MQIYICIKNIADLLNQLANMDHGERKTFLDTTAVYYDSLTDRWICRICNNSYTRKISTIDHIERTHLQLMSYSCEYCESKFTCSSLKRSHVNTYHREQNQLAISRYHMSKDHQITQPIQFLPQ